MQIKTPLTGERVAVRDYFAADLPFVEGLWFDPEVNRYMSDPARECADERYFAALAAMEDDADGYYLIICRRADGAPIGTCCAFPEEGGVWDIGYTLSPVEWHKGLASEALELLLAWIAGQGARAVTAEVARENAASRALLERHGFCPEREASFKKWNMPVVFPSYIYRLTL